MEKKKKKLLFDMVWILLSNCFVLLSFFLVGSLVSIISSLVSGSTLLLF
jgi:hypothetical protein